MYHRKPTTILFFIDASHSAEYESFHFNFLVVWNRTNFLPSLLRLQSNQKDSSQQQSQPQTNSQCDQEQSNCKKLDAIEEHSDADHAPRTNSIYNIYVKCR